MRCNKSRSDAIYVVSPVAPFVDQVIEQRLLAARKKQSWNILPFHGSAEPVTESSYDAPQAGIELGTRRYQCLWAVCSCSSGVSVEL